MVLKLFVFFHEKPRKSLTHLTDIVTVHPSTIETRNKTIKEFTMTGKDAKFFVSFFVASLVAYIILSLLGIRFRMEFMLFYVVFEFIYIVVFKQKITPRIRAWSLLGLLLTSLLILLDKNVLHIFM
jgi:hypothetical protein